MLPLAGQAQARGSAAHSYIVRRIGGGAPAEQFSTTALSVTDSSAHLQTNQKYTYKVKAVDAAGNIGPLAPQGSFEIRTPLTRHAARVA